MMTGGSSSAGATPGWYADPWGTAGARWWDGSAWTDRSDHDAGSESDVRSVRGSEQQASTNEGAPQLRAARRASNAAAAPISEALPSIAAPLPTRRAARSLATAAPEVESSSPPANVIPDASEAPPSKRRGARPVEPAQVPPEPAQSAEPMPLPTARAEAKARAAQPTALMAKTQPAPPTPELIAARPVVERPVVVELSRDVQTDASSLNPELPRPAPAHPQSFPDQIVGRSQRFVEDRPLPSVTYRPPPSPITYHPLPGAYADGNRTTLMPMTKNGPATASLVFTLIGVVGVAAVVWGLTGANLALAQSLTVIILASFGGAFVLALAGLVIAVTRPTKKGATVLALVVSSLLLLGVTLLFGLHLI